MKSKILTRSRRGFIIIGLLFLASMTTSGEMNSSSRHFDETEMTNYLSSADFDYMNLTVQPPSIWQRIKWWFAALIAKIFSNPNAPWLSNILFYIILMLVVSVAVYYIVRMRYAKAVSSGSGLYASNAVGDEKELQQLNFDKLIEEALSVKNYKLAIRYQYLKTLRFLASKEVIKLKDWKSPYDYEKELDMNVVPPYRELTQLFEYVWYGDISVESKDFREGEKLSLAIEDELK